MKKALNSFYLLKMKGHIHVDMEGNQKVEEFILVSTGISER